MGLRLTPLPPATAVPGQAAAGRFEIGDVVATHRDGDVVIRKHSSGSFTALVGGEPKPARQYLMAMRDAMGLPDKTNNTTRSLGAQVFATLGNQDAARPR